MSTSPESLLGLIKAGQVSMPPTALIFRLAVITTILGFFARIVYNIFLHPLRVVPGPWWYAATGLPRYRMYMSGDAHKILRDMHMEYGDVVRIGPNEVSFAGAHGWSDVFGQKRMPGTEANGGHAYVENPKETVFYNNISRPGSLLYMPQADHIMARKSLNAAFSTKAVSEQEPLIQSHIDRLVGLLHAAAEKSSKKSDGKEGKDDQDSNVVDMVQYTNWLFFDIIGELGFGEPFGSLVDGAEHAWVAMIAKGVKGGVTKVNLHRLLGTTLARLAIWLKMTREARDQLMWHHTMSDDKIKRRRVLGPGRADFVTPMLENEDFWTTKRMHASLTTFITAGAETSATAVSAALYFLSTTPAPAAGGQSPLEKLQAEVRGAFSSEAEINFAGVKNLPYLGAVLDEALRMHPPTVWGFGRQAKAGGTTVANGQFYLPEATVLTISYYAMFRNKRNFALPDTFAPERWLTGAGADKRFQNDQRDAFHPFSYGPRNCIGRYLAVADMRAVLARIVFNFDLATQPDSIRWAADQKTYAFWEKPPLMMGVTERADKA
ncbi:hypothetical protein HMPREF1624_02388 [Sporothrix schenckii ATCC 58251]|uniref:Cytochrome P450 monooxygenase n=1 Tax=Sporothrix schenckii (strain ATCC 58251 / de Perez 2211183) TaxID=1391915 RepID=U7PZW0_SPOS1|nr:hypothetical protein HMPREF1624_02388 [Sporothrix schenckii ATCC 58251]